MKKYLILASLILVFIPNLNKESDEIVIPDEAIRFRVVAESNTKEDQETKTIVKEALEEDLQKPVITSNQATFWHTLRLSKIASKVKGFGQLFSY